MRSTTIHIRLPVQVKKAIRIRAVQQGISSGEYIVRLVEADAEAADALKLVRADDSATEEVRHGR